MREKRLWALLSFDSTHEALRFEEAAQTAQLTGRLIPLPSCVRAGCGLAWRSPLDLRERVVALVAKLEIRDSEIHEVWL
ncbi:MAG: DUF3343 domain-containing protein [Eubacteriales bacterium]|nr:DUF3343 domain-containing protein [Eubacteriales bacterium]